MLEPKKNCVRYLHVIRLYFQLRYPSKNTELKSSEINTKLYMVIY
jgi:hypothetical protein